MPSSVGVIRDWSRRGELEALGTASVTAKCYERGQWRNWRDTAFSASCALTSGRRAERMLRAILSGVGNRERHLRLSGRVHLGRHQKDDGHGHD